MIEDDDTFGLVPFALAICFVCALGILITGFLAWVAP
ncbi:MAG: hypothetical protein RL651_2084 [Pseudomonadota bacterium]|jgi:hypothetical protein